MQWRLPLNYWLAILLFAASTMFAKVGPRSLAEMFTQSRIVAVVKVERHRKAAGLLWAEAVVLQSVKGAQVGETVIFLAQPTWTCDTSKAPIGEEALVLLLDAHDPKTWLGYFTDLDRSTLPAGACLLAASGRGRLPLRSIEGDQYVTAWSDIGVETGIRPLPGPEREYDVIRSFRLLELLHWLKEYGAKGGA